MTESTWLTYEQAAQRLGCSTKTIQRLVARNQLQAHKKVGQRERLIPAEEIAALETPAPIGDNQP